MPDAQAIAGFYAGWNAALEEAAKIVEGDLRETTMERRCPPVNGGKMVPHHRDIPGSKQHAAAIRGLIKAAPYLEKLQIPKGWKLVPEELTLKMYEAMFHDYIAYEKQGPNKRTWNGRTMWQVALLTAPAPPASKGLPRND
jgi:hypothetical protein